MEHIKVLERKKEEMHSLDNFESSDVISNAPPVPHFWRICLGTRKYKKIGEFHDALANIGIHLYKNEPHRIYDFVVVSFSPRLMFLFELKYSDLIMDTEAIIVNYHHNTSEKYYKRLFKGNNHD